MLYRLGRIFIKFASQYDQSVNYVPVLQCCIAYGEFLLNSHRNTEEDHGRKPVTAGRNLAGDEPAAEGIEKASEGLVRGIY